METNIRRTLVASSAVAGAAAGFLIYSVFRGAFSRDFGLDPALSFWCLIASAAIPSVVLFPCAVWKVLRHSRGDWFPWTLCGTLFLGIVAGDLAAELVILCDEAVFRSEVAADPGVDRHRARAWPNRHCSLLYAPSRGFWVND